MYDFGGPQELPTILLIDDDPISREVMATVLTMSGFTIYTADGGAPALQLLSDGDCVPSVILMDAQMPELSGIQLIDRLRARSSARIFAISGSTPPADILAAADGFLLKPFTGDSLRSLLEKNRSNAGPPTHPIAGPSSPKSSSPPPIVDPATLAQLREMMSETAVRQIYAAIVADLGRRIDAIEIAISKKDLAEIRRIGHAIKGGCGMAGALQTARLGADLESPINHLDNSPALLEKLRAATKGLERMLEDEFKAE